MTDNEKPLSGGATGRGASGETGSSSADLQDRAKTAPKSRNKGVPSWKKRLYPLGRDVSVYNKRGVFVTHREKWCPNPEGLGRGLRGEIGGWSASSRRRMRELLLTNREPIGWRSLDVTYTIPGPLPTADQSRSVWSDFRRDVADWGWLMIWRVEVQRRGALHWHCLIAVPPGEQKLHLPGLGGGLDVMTADAEAAVSMAWWWRGLYRFGRHEGGETAKGVQVPPGWRVEWPGSSRAVDVKTDDGSDRWLRYMSDHATKAKQGQLGVGIGRHWGVCGRRHLRKLDPDGSCYLTDRQYQHYKRALQRLATPRVKDPRAVFGRRLGFRLRRGNHGSAPWFGRTLTHLRLISWARSLSPTPHPLRV